MEQDAPPQAAQSELTATESLKPSPALEATRGWCRRGAALAPLLQRACPGPPGHPTLQRAPAELPVRATETLIFLLTNSPIYIFLIQFTKTD